MMLRLTLVTSGVATVALIVLAVVLHTAAIGFVAALLAVVTWRLLDYATPDRDIRETRNGRIVKRPSTAWLIDGLDRFRSRRHGDR
jgi:hypothetical protein